MSDKIAEFDNLIDACKFMLNYNVDTYFEFFITQDLEEQSEIVYYSEPYVVYNFIRFHKDKFIDYLESKRL